MCVCVLLWLFTVAIGWNLVQTLWSQAASLRKTFMGSCAGECEGAGRGWGAVGERGKEGGGGREKRE